MIFKLSSSSVLEEKSLLPTKRDAQTRSSNPLEEERERQHQREVSLRASLLARRDLGVPGLSRTTTPLDEEIWDRFFFVKTKVCFTTQTKDEEERGETFQKSKFLFFFLKEEEEEEEEEKAKKFL